ncbi:hypothetical protein HAX54_026759 [Datura stramonium]|uniref:Uncharacterized protein n=1 Tax=Datura stramonium TaxID=4076 RepID=A0ABS8V2A3_DATST|nr:hypothetical protein [Datura stramonium]
MVESSSEESNSKNLSPNTKEFTPTRQQLVMASVSLQVATSTENSKPSKENSPIISSHDRELLDALVSSDVERFSNLQGKDIYEEGGEEDELAQCFANVVKKADISPRQMIKKNKSHERKKSSDSILIGRTLPMRSAKQVTLFTKFYAKLSSGAGKN